TDCRNSRSERSAMFTPATMHDVSIPDAPGAKPAGAFEQLIEERKRVESYTKEQYARLTRLRELIREEKAAAESDLDARRQELQSSTDGAWKTEIERLRLELEELRGSLEKVYAERNRFQAALVQVGQQNRRLQQQVLQLEQQAVEAERVRIDKERR